MSAGIKHVEKGILNRLDGMLDRQKSLRSFLDRNVYRIYQNVQRQRWMEEGASEGAHWERLNPAYAKRKLTLYKEYEGGGSKMLIATGKLYKSVIGPGEGFRKVVTDRSLTIATTIKYAPFVDEARSFTTYSQSTRARFRKAIGQFVFNNVLFDIQRIT